MLTFALQTKLAADSVVTDQLATFVFGTGEAAKPAIFIFDNDRGRIPETCDLPAIIIDALGDGNFSTRGADGSRQIARIRIYGPRKRTTILALAWDVWHSVTKKTLTPPSGWEVIANLADAPQQLPDPDGFPGYVVSVRANVFKTP